MNGALVTKVSAAWYFKFSLRNVGTGYLLSNNCGSIYDKKTIYLYKIQIDFNFKAK